jgi:hypothetical protein
MENTWKSGLKKYFGASSCSKWHQLAADVQCVALGLKPAYLLDTLTPDPALFCSLLTHVSSELHRDEMLSSGLVAKCTWSELRVVSVGSDVLVVNWTAIQELFRKHLCVYVNIGKTGGPCQSTGDLTDAHISVERSPEVEKKCRQWCSELIATEHPRTDAECFDTSECSRVKMVSVTLTPGMNLCTLFGRLLGYPVVYWFPPTAGYSLDLVELVNCHVTASSSSLSAQGLCTMKDHQLYSFSVPRCVESTTRETVCAWFQRLREKAVTLGVELTQRNTLVSLPSVAL